MNECRRMISFLNEEIREFAHWARNMREAAAEPIPAVEILNHVNRAFHRGKVSAYDMVVRHLIRKRQVLQRVTEAF